MGAGQGQDRNRTGAGQGQDRGQDRGRVGAGPALAWEIRPQGRLGGLELAKGQRGAEKQARKRVSKFSQGWFRDLRAQGAGVWGSLCVQGT